MKLRAPAIPLVTCNPFFSIFSPFDELNGGNTTHWSGKNCRMKGILLIQGQKYCFMGKPEEGEIAAKQISLSITALCSTYTFAVNEFTFQISFFTPKLLDNVDLLSWPVSYMDISLSSKQGELSDCEVVFQFYDDICQDKAEESPAPSDHNNPKEASVQRPISYSEIQIENIICGKMGLTDQNPLSKSGDEVNIDWGYLYAASNHANTSVSFITESDSLPANQYIRLCIRLTKDLPTALVVLAYDDIRTLMYFGEIAQACYKGFYSSMEKLIQTAFSDYRKIMDQGKAFSSRLSRDALSSGGEEYEALLSLAYRQVTGAHQLCFAPDGETLYISKECYSGGFGATVDVTYPAIPLYLLYAPKLIEGMLRPIIRYAESPSWSYPFAPHDAGVYPLINGQKYGSELKDQMPVEECGNMLIIATAMSVVMQDVSFVEKHWSLFEKWCSYLIEQGFNPSDQLCTDDFAGHLAQNCNLSVKAIMGIASFGILCRMTGRDHAAEKHLSLAKEWADNWVTLARNEDNTTRLAFNQPGSFSLKYNMIWDILFQTKLFPKELYLSEAESYLKKHKNPYGVALDSRATYTKSDWLLWVACLTDEPSEFSEFVHMLYQAYHNSESRVPMSDWYDTLTAKQVGFQNRTVQGGLFMKVLKDKKLCKA